MHAISQLNQKSLRDFQSALNLTLHLDMELQLLGKKIYIAHLIYKFHNIKKTPLDNISLLIYQPLQTKYLTLNYSTTDCMCDSKNVLNLSAILLVRLRL